MNLPAPAAPAPGLRPAQERALSYTGGRLAIAAAPGSGKTFILTQLIVRLIGDLAVSPEEILVLTYMRSAALTLKQRAAAELARRHKSARGLRASTIHAFCQGVLRQELSRYGDEGGALSVIAESARRTVAQAGVEAFLASGQHAPALERELRTRPRADVVRGAVEAALDAIRTAKQASCDPRELEIAAAPEIGFVARHYEDHLAQRRLLDFDDMIGRTVRMFEERPDALAAYQDRIRFVLEDEAQDSTPLQNRLLEILSARHGNLVRVGDPNQAILASFTSNDPRYFREFCQSVPTVDMSESSRSAPEILALANSLVALTARHPDLEIRQALGGTPILPATVGPRNPDSAELSWSVHPGKDPEIIAVLSEVRQYLRDHPARTCAILCASNAMIAKPGDGTGFLASARAMGLPLAAAPPSGPEPGSQGDVFEHALALLDAPATDPIARLAELTRARAATLGRDAGRPTQGRVLAALEDLGIRQLVVPPHLRPARPRQVDEATYAAVVETARAVERLLPRRARPADELLLAIAQELLEGEPGALLVAGRLAQLAQRRELRPDVSPLAELRALVAELRADGRFDRLVAPDEDPPELTGGHLAILTLHKSKGAEYDAVWIPNAGYYFDGLSHFPWLPGETRQPDAAMLIAAQAARGTDFAPHEAVLAQQRTFVAERLRLLYVGITRARHRLSLSCYSRRGSAAPWHVLELARRMS